MTAHRSTHLTPWQRMRPIRVTSRLAEGEIWNKRRWAPWKEDPKRILLRIPGEGRVLAIWRCTDLIHELRNFYYPGYRVRCYYQGKDRDSDNKKTHFPYTFICVHRICFYCTSRATHIYNTWIQNTVTDFIYVGVYVDYYSNPMVHSRILTQKEHYSAAERYFMEHGYKNAFKTVNRSTVLLAKVAITL